MKNLNKLARQSSSLIKQSNQIITKGNLKPFKLTNNELIDKVTPKSNSSVININNITNNQLKNQDKSFMNKVKEVKEKITNNKTFQDLFYQAVYKIYPVVEKSNAELSLDKKTYENLLKINEKIEKIIIIASGYDDDRFANLITKERFNTYEKNKNNINKVREAQDACTEQGAIDLLPIMEKYRAGNCGEQAFLFKELAELKNFTDVSVDVYHTMENYLEGGDHGLVIVSLKLDNLVCKPIHVFDPFLGIDMPINKAIKFYNTLNNPSKSKPIFKRKFIHCKKEVLL